MTYCNGGDSGPVLGQLASVELSPALAVQGESLNYGQIGQGLSATGYDCKGSVVSTSGIVYATTQMSYADINPSNGQVCGGTWNRNTSGGIANYTLCTAPALTAGSEPVAYVTATANGITSNAVPVYVHAMVTSIAFGVGGGCSSTDPDTTCCPADPNTVISGLAPYNGYSCVSQGGTSQIAARVYAGSTNITCGAGHLNFGTSNSSIASLDQNGVITSLMPGSTTITAELSNSSSASTIGYFSACAPKTITITPVGNAGATSINVPLNNTQPFTTTVTDTLGAPITGLSLTFPSSNPQIVPLSSGTVTPAFPGTSTITAICEPPSCNPAPVAQLGYNGNGKSVTSNGISVTATGSSSTAIYVGSTYSRYVLPYDFSTGIPGSIIKLPYAPNSMAITEDGTTVYFGSTFGLMSMSTSTNVVSANNTLMPGTIISIAPSGGTLVITDAFRQTISLVTGGSTVSATYGGVATHASWSDDGNTVYITTAGGTPALILNHSANSNWQTTPVTGGATGGNPALTTADTNYVDVTSLEPSVGAYFAGSPSTDGRSYCPYTTYAAGTSAPPATDPPITTNVFTALADVKPVITDRVSATTDGKHVLGANSTTTSPAPYLSDIFITSATGVCTANTSNTTPLEPAITYTSSPKTFAFTGITPTKIDGVVPANNSAIAFVLFDGTGNGKVPYYLPNTASNAGALNYLTLNTALGTPTAPIAGVFSTDNFTFYLGTAGDNAVHLLNVTYPTGLAPAVNDSTTPINPALPLDPTVTIPTGVTIPGPFVPPNLIVQRPRKSLT